jgi:hypothetical protein
MIKYIVEALRGGNREKHSYVVGIYDDKQEAVRNALAEEYWRGGKYECVVEEVVPNSFEREKIDYLVSCVGSWEDMEEKIDLRIQLIDSLKDTAKKALGEVNDEN